MSALTDIEQQTYAEKRHRFSEVEMAAILAGVFAIKRKHEFNVWRSKGDMIT